MKQIILFAAALAFISCSEDNSGDAPLGSYDNGILVLNEGGAGSVSYISNDLGTVRQDIFTAVNEGQDIGQYTQSIFFDGARAFIISNGSNKITVVNRYSFEYIATISSGLSVPRYGAVANGKAYVTNMASFFSETDDYVAVIDLEDLSVGEPIAINDLADRITSGGGKIWVANGAFGSGDSVTVIDPSTESVVSVIQTGLAPQGLEIVDETLFVLSSTDGAGSRLARIDTQTMELLDFVEIPGLYASNLDIEGEIAYFTAGSKIHAMPVWATEFINLPLLDTMSESDYIGYGFAVNAGRIYISEAAEDFSSDGRVLIYDLQGNPLADIPAGLGPNGFYFN